MRRGIIAVLALLVLVPFAEAGRDDDFDFAQGLMDRKFYDLAKEQFEKIINDPSASGEQQAAGELGLAILLKAQADDARADSKREVSEVLELYAAAESRFDKFLGSFPNHSKRDLAKFQVGTLLHSKGLFLRGKMESDPDKAAEYKAGAEDAFDAAIDLFKESAEILEEKAQNDPSADWPSRRARFYELAANYDKGMVYEAGGAERQGILKKTSSMCENFIWENEENLFGGYAYMYWGLVMKGLDEPETAMTYFVTCADMPLPSIAADGISSYTHWTNLFMQSYWKLAEYANELGNRDGTDFRDTAIEQITNMQTRIPDCWERQFGHRALLEYARALMGLEKFGEAQTIVAKISQKGDEISAREEWGLGTAFLANKLLNEIITEARIGGVELKAPPDVLLKAASGKKALRQWAAAVRSYQGVISSSESPEEINEFAKPAWMEIGECYYRSEKFFEAYFTYDRIEREFEGEEIAGDAAYYRYRAITARHVETKDPRDLALKKKARADFATKYKDHPRSIDLQYYEGADLISDADSFRGGGDQNAAGAAYNEALTRLLNTKKSSILYAKAQARIGEVFYKQKKYPEAQKKFAAVFTYVNDPKNPTTDPQRQANRLQASAIATFFSARCYKETAEWDKVLSTLDGYETKFADENVRNFHAPVKFERIRAFIQTNQLPEAEQQALSMRTDWPQAEQLPIAFSMLSRAMSAAAKKALETNQKDEWSKLLTKAAEYYSFYIEIRMERNPAKTPSWQEHQLIGFWYFDLGDMPNAEPNLEKSYTILLGVIEKMADSDRKENLKLQADSLLQKLSEILLRQKKYGEAKEKLEKLLIPDEGARPRVLDLLKEQELSKVALKELMDKIQAIPSLMEGLARTYKAVGGPEDLLRALTLVKLLGRADPKNKYTKVGWERKYLMCEIYLQYGRDFRDEAALDNVIKLINDWESLGVLKNSGMAEKFKKLRSEALSLK
jgi:hypothetical protein